MNYENYLTSENEATINELKGLLNEAKEDLNEATIRKSLNNSLESIKRELRAYIEQTSELKLNQVGEHLEHYNYNRLESLFLANRDRIAKSLAFLVDFESLFLANSQKFTALNERILKDKIRELLVEDNAFNEALENYKNELEGGVNSIENEARARLEAFSIEDYAREYLSEAIERTLGQALSIHESEIIDNFAQGLLNNEVFKNSLINDILQKSTFKNELKNRLEQTLEALNVKAIEKALNNKALKRQLFLNALITSEMSLQNELKTINSIMSGLNEMSLHEKRREFLESINEQNANAIMENKFKAV